MDKRFTPVRVIATDRLNNRLVHGVATNGEGDVFVSEFSTFGRVDKFDRR